jgi:tRNA A22 N-methylase
MHLSDHAVMTCLVVSPTDGQHVHFVDGGDGGYTQAATQLKAQLAESVANART